MKKLSTACFWMLTAFIKFVHGGINHTVAIPEIAEKRLPLTYSTTGFGQDVISSSVGEMTAGELDTALQKKVAFSTGLSNQ